MNHYFLSAYLRHMKVSKKRPVVISFPQLFSLFCSKWRGLGNVCETNRSQFRITEVKASKKNGKTETKTILDDLKMPKPIASASFLSSLSIIHDDTRSQLLGRFLPVQAWIIDLVTVFDAILTSRQTCERSQCLYENLTSYNFRKTAVLKKISIVN